MRNTQLYLVIGVPILFNGLLFVFGFTRLLTKVNHLMGELMDLDSRISKLSSPTV
jgi:hypothetical protein